MHSVFVRARVDVDNYVVPGLYFKGKLNSQKLIDDIIRNFELDNETVHGVIQMFSEHLDSVLIPADYENALTFIRDEASKHQINVSPDTRPEQRDEIDERNR